MVHLRATRKGFAASEGGVQIFRAYPIFFCKTNKFLMWQGNDKLRQGTLRIYFYPVGTYSIRQFKFSITFADEHGPPYVTSFTFLNSNQILLDSLN